ncbi:MAG: hypothetical protein AAF251_08245 [Pseudomonadota bacterium]
MAAARAASALRRMRALALTMRMLIPAWRAIILDSEDRKALVSFFGVDEQRLGGPAQTPMDGIIELPVLDMDASAGFGAIASNETSYTSFGFDEKWLR